MAYKNKEKAKEAVKQWQEINREKYLKQKRIYCKQYYIDNREKVNKKNSLWRENNPEKVKEYKIKFTKNNPVYIKEYFKKYYEKRKNIIKDYKLSKGCSVCGYNKCAEALDFHHNGDKKFGIGEALANKRNIKKIKEEMEKCVLLCAKCHREYHASHRAGRKGGHLNENRND